MTKRRSRVAYNRLKYVRRQRYQLKKALKAQESNNNPGDAGAVLRGPAADTDHPWDPSIVKEEPLDDLPNNNGDDYDELDIKPDVDSIDVKVNTTPTPKSSSSPRTNKSKRKPRKASSSGPKKKMPPQPKKKKQDGNKKKTKKKQEVPKETRPARIAGGLYPDNWDSMSPEEKEAWRLERRRQTAREHAALRRAFKPEAIAKYKRRELTKEEKEERNKRNSFQQFVRRAAMTEEELKEHKMKIYMGKCARLSILTQEEVEEKRKKDRIAAVVKKAKMTPEEREEKRRRAAEARKNRTEEEKARQREISREYQRKYWAKMKAERPLEYQARIHDMMVKNREKMLVLLRKRNQNETPEQREQRLLRYRVNQAKRKARKQLEEEGVTSPEEIERRLEEVAETVRNQPRAPFSREYKPREGARKPHAKRRPLVTPEEAGIVIRTGVKGKLPKYPEIYSKMAEVDDKEKISRMDIPTMFPKTWEKVGKDINSELDGEKEPRLPTLHEFEPVVARPLSFQPVPKPPPPAPVPDSTSNNNNNNFELGMNEEDSCDSHPSYGGGEDDDIEDDFPMEFDTTGGDVEEEEDDDDPIPELEPQHCQQGKEEVGEQILLPSSMEPPPLRPRLAPSPVSYVPPPSLVLTASTSAVVVPSTPHVKKEVVGALVAVPPSQPQSGAIVKPEVAHDKLPEEAVVVRDEDSVSVSPVICDICGKVLKTEHSLKRHKETLHDVSPKETRCPQCGLECGSSRKLWTHYSTTHMGQVSSEESEDKAIVVHSKVANNTSYINPAPPPPSSRQVAQKRGTDGSNTCWHCGKNFKQKATMDDHMRRVHEGKGFYCDLCPSRGDLQSYAKLWKHKVDKHGIPPEELLPPTDRWGVIPIVNCVYCGEVLLRGYEAHVKKRHPEELDQWRAGNMNNAPFGKIKNASLLRVHQPDGSTKLARSGSGRAIPRSTATNCPECSKVVTMGSLRRHLKMVHGIGQIEMLKCDECGREFKDRQRLTEHIKYQHQYCEIDDRLEAKGLVKFDRPLKQVDCLVCNNNQAIKIVGPDSLRAHFVAEHHLLLDQIQFSTEPLFPCDHCPQKLMNRKARHVHVREAHPEVEPPSARAPHLGKSGGGGRGGARKPNRGTKMKIGEIANLRTLCSKCGKVVRLRDVTPHLRTKHGEKDPRFICEFCNKSFRRREYHVCHLEMVHKVPRDQLIAVPTKEEVERSKAESYKHLKKNKKHFKKRRVGRPSKCAKPVTRTEESTNQRHHQWDEIEKTKRLVIKVVRLTQEEIDGGYYGGA